MSWLSLLQGLVGGGSQPAPTEQVMQTVRGARAGASCQEYLSAVKEALSSHEKLAELCASQGLSEDELRAYLGNLQGSLEQELATVRGYLSALQTRVEELTTGKKVSFELHCSQCGQANQIWMTNCQSCGRNLAPERGLWEQNQSVTASPFRLGKAQRNQACARFEQLCHQVRDKLLQPVLFSGRVKSLSLEIGNEIADLSHLPSFENEHYLLGLNRVMTGLRHLQDACRIGRAYVDRLDPTVLERAMRMIPEAEELINSGQVLLDHAKAEYGLADLIPSESPLDDLSGGML